MTILFTALLGMQVLAFQLDDEGVLIQGGRDVTRAVDFLALLKAAAPPPDGKFDLKKARPLGVEQVLGFLSPRGIQISDGSSKKAVVTPRQRLETELRGAKGDSYVALLRLGFAASQPAPEKSKLKFEPVDGGFRVSVGREYRITFRADGAVKKVSTIERMR